mgnify:CR=1 FL=1
MPRLKCLNITVMNGIAVRPSMDIVMQIGLFSFIREQVKMENRVQDFGIKINISSLAVY